MSIDFIVLIFSLVFIRIPFALNLEGSRALMLIVLTPFWFVIVKNLFLTRFFLVIRKPNKVAFIFFCLFVYLILSAIIRGYTNDLYSTARTFYELFLMITVILFGVSVFLSLENKGMDAKMRMGIVYAIGIYIGLNALLHILGVRPSTDRLVGLTGAESFSPPATILALFGIKAYRTLFPMADGINNFGTLAGASLAAGIVMLLCAAPKLINKIIASIIIISSLYTILLADIRGGLFSAFVALLITLLIPKKQLQWLPNVSLIIPVLPMILMRIAVTLSNINFLSNLSRGDANIATFSGRSFFWEIAIKELSKLSAIHLIGFGVYGQAASGVSQGYSDLFLDRTAINPDAVSLHNVGLQYIFDIGYLGLAVFMIMLFFAFRQLLYFLEMNDAGTSRIMIVLLTYFIFAGMFEVVPTIYMKEIFIVFCFIIISSLPASRLKYKKSINQSNCHSEYFGFYN